jgi:hypothetical protein
MEVQTQGGVGPRGGVGVSSSLIGVVEVIFWEVDMPRFFDVDGPAAVGDVARILLPLGVFLGVSGFLGTSKTTLKIISKASNQ